MAKERDLQFWRGSESSRSGVTPLAAEPLWTTDTDHSGRRLYMGDGSTAGGHLVGPHVSRVGHRSQWWTFPTQIVTAPTGTTTFTSVGKIQFYAWECGGNVAVSFDRIGVHVTTADASGNVRLAVYDDDDDGFPGTLIDESSALSTASTGRLTHTLGGSSIELYPGWYWLAVQCDSSTAQFYRMTGSQLSAHAYSMPDSASFSTARRTQCRQTWTFGSFPSTASIATTNDAVGVLTGMRAL